MSASIAETWCCRDTDSRGSRVAASWYCRAASRHRPRRARPSAWVRSPAVPGAPVRASATAACSRAAPSSPWSRKTSAIRRCRPASICSDCRDRTTCRSAGSQKTRHGHRPDCWIMRSPASVASESPSSSVSGRTTGSGASSVKTPTTSSARRPAAESPVVRRSKLLRQTAGTGREGLCPVQCSGGTADSRSRIRPGRPPVARETCCTVMRSSRTPASDCTKPWISGTDSGGMVTVRSARLRTVSRSFSASSRALSAQVRMSARRP